MDNMPWDSILMLSYWLSVGWYNWIVKNPKNVLSAEISINYDVAELGNFAKASICVSQYKDEQLFGYFTAKLGL